VSLLDKIHWQPPGGAWPEDFADPAYQAHLAASKAAAERRKAYVRLYTQRGSVAHLSPPWDASPRGVLCRFVPMWPGEWLGTGSQAEYELAAELETCSRCRNAFMDSQRCGNSECPCQKWGGRPTTLVARVAGGDR
jgi:hypothetical protein